MWVNITRGVDGKNVVEAQTAQPLSELQGRFKGTWIE